jgi:hypothetical protein
MINTLPQSLIDDARSVLLENINHEIVITEAKKDIEEFNHEDRKLPYADISHHHHRKYLIEGNIADWVNHKQPWEHQINNFNMGTSVHGLSTHTYETPDSLEDLATEHINNLDGHHHQTVDAYITGGLEDGHDTGSKFVNDHLIKSHKMKKTPNKEFSFGEDPDFQKVLNIDHLDEALSKNKLDKQLTTYSGIGFHPKELMKDGNLVHLPAYTSSSTNRAVALMYSKKDKNNDYHVLQIKHPKGSTGLYLGDNEDLTPFRQKEHISPRNITLKVNPEPEIHTDTLGNKVHIWKATRLLSKESK